MMDRQFRHINYAMLLRITGWLLIIESCFMLMPLATSMIYGEEELRAFLLSTLITLAAGLLATFCIRPHRTNMGRHEGFLLTAMVWIAFSAFGMLPFLLSARPLTVSEAFFESMSGFTTTGCTMLTSVNDMAKSVAMWRALMQWMGGMGIILFTLAVIPMLNSSGGMQMFNAEVTGITHDKLRPRISSTAKALWMIYIILTVSLILLLWAGPMDLFDSICHAFSTISTGGFSTHDASLAYYNSDYINFVVLIFMFLGGTSFALVYRSIIKRPCRPLSNDVFRTYVIMILCFYIVFALTIYFTGNYTGWRSVTIYPLFQIVSTITSTGLSVCNFESWGPFILSLIFFLMFTGACAGSTSGGAKIDRIVTLYKNLCNQVYKCIHPNAVTNVRVNDKPVPQPLVSKVVAFVCIYVILIAIGGTLLTALGLPLVDSFFSAFSCVSNTGFGAGVTGYAGNFDIIPDTGKWVLSALMLIGRLEIFTVLILFVPSFWKK